MENRDFFASIDIVNFVLIGSSLHVSVWKRPHEPFAGCMALPGAIVNGRTPDATLDDTVNRVIQERLHQTPVYIEQVGTVGSATRDARSWSMTTVYLSLHTHAGTHSDVSLAPLDEILSGVAQMAFDHQQLVVMAYKHLRDKARFSTLPMYLVPSDEFTVKRVTESYQAVIAPSVKAITIRKRMEYLEEIGTIRQNVMFYPAKGRPAMTYTKPEATHLFDRLILAS